jgi:hypothetical protein
MPNSIKIILLAFGGLMLLVALLGSGFSVREISFPPMSPLIRTTTVVVGAGLMATSIVLFGTGNGSTRDDVLPTQTPTPTVTTPSPTPSTPTPDPETTTPEPPPDAGTTLAQPEDEPVAASALLGHVPSDIASSCKPGSETISASLTVYVECAPGGGADAVAYYQFADTPSMKGWYSKITDDYTPFDSDSCASASNLNGETTYTQGDSGTDAGSVACFYDSSDDTVNLVWTNDDLAILTWAYSGPSDYSELHEWWIDAGPVDVSGV